MYYQFPQIINRIRQIYQLKQKAYLMQCGQQSQNNHSKSDNYLAALQSKLSLKDVSKEQRVDQSSRYNDYDILFAEGAQEPKFNQLFNNSFHQNHNFSEIGEQSFEDDSLFNAKDGGCFHQDNKKEESIEEDLFSIIPQRQPALFTKKSQSTQQQKYQSMDRGTKILQILKMKDRQNKAAHNKSQDSQRQSISQTKFSSKSLVLKPKLQNHRSQSHSAIKFVKKILDDTSNIANRIRTESNQPSNNFNYQVNQICRTDYDDLNDQRNTYGMIIEQKDSLQCTFKPTILKQCLLSINNKTKMIQAPVRKSYQKSTKCLSQKTSNSHSLKGKNNEKQQKGQQTQHNKIGLNKKSSIYASGSTLDVVTRNQMWLIQREQKLSQKRKEEEQQKLKQQDYTFKPAINLYRKQNKNPSKATEKDVISPYFQRLSMAKRKNTVVKFKKDEVPTQIAKISENGPKQKNKENLVSMINNDKDLSQVFRYKKQRYQEAVKELHHKIMKMNL